MSLLFFVVQLSQVPAIKSGYSLLDRKSGANRSIPDQASLRHFGNRVQIFVLQGYIFFGSVYSLSTQLRKTLNKDSAPVCLVLDLSRVVGFDSAASDALQTIIQQAIQKKIEIVLCTTGPLQKNTKWHVASNAFGCFLA